jgi:hypothetical protein
VTLSKMFVRHFGIYVGSSIDVPGEAGIVADFRMSELGRDAGAAYVDGVSAFSSPRLFIRRYIDRSSS